MELHEWNENVVNVEYCQFLKENCNVFFCYLSEMETGRSTVKPVYNDHLGDKVSLVVIDMWLL